MKNVLIHIDDEAVKRKSKLPEKYTHLSVYLEGLRVCEEQEKKNVKRAAKTRK